jgi:chromosome segregation ATPase
MKGQYQSQVNQNKGLQKDIQNLNNSITGLEGKISGLNKNIQNKEGDITDLQKRLAQADAANQAGTKFSSNQQGIIKGLEKSLQDYKGQLSQLKAGLQDKEGELKGLRKQLAQSESKNQGSQKINEGLKSNIAGLNKNIDGLNGKIAGLNQTVAGKKANEERLRQTIQDLQGSFDSTKGKNNALTDKISDLQNQMAQLKSQVGTLKVAKQYEGQKTKALNNEVDRVLTDYKSLEGKNRNLEGTIEGLNRKLRRNYAQLADLKKQKLQPEEDKKAVVISKLEAELEKLKTENGLIKNKATKAQRKIASVQNNFRTNIGRKLAKRLRDANIDVYVDPTTGNVILRMDKNFLFKKNSAVLSNGAKRTLQKVIPLYVEELFADKEITGKINTVNIIGHASPSHRQRFVDPFDPKNRRAYNYNLDLSSDRARSIVKYIFSRSFGNFNHKGIFREKVQAIGKSFSEPVKRRPASAPTKKCGIYDCKLSRRVEISFTLKDNKEAWETIDSLNQGL